VNFSRWKIHSSHLKTAFALKSVQFPLAAAANLLLDAHGSIL
jgi:hypothetical protein